MLINALAGSLPFSLDCIHHKWLTGGHTLRVNSQNIAANCSQFPLNWSLKLDELEPLIAYLQVLVSFR